MNKALCVSAALAMALSGAAFAGGGAHKSPRASAGSDTSAQISAGNSEAGAGVSADISVGASSDSSSMEVAQGSSSWESSQHLGTGSTSASAGGELSGSVSGGIAEDFRSPRD